MKTKGVKSKYYQRELKILEKYWKHLGIKPKKRKEALYEFCEKHTEDFYRETHFKMINSTITYSNKSPIPIVIETIPIYKHEFDYISNLLIEERLKKVLLAFLIEKKIHKEIYNILNVDESAKDKISVYFTGSNKSVKAIKTSSKIPNKYNIDHVIYELKTLDFLDVLNRGMLKLKYIDDINNMSSEKIADIKTYDEAGHVYDLLDGKKKMGICCDCGMIIKKRANNQVRCKKCSDEHLTNYNTEKKREYRDKTRKIETVG